MDLFSFSLIVALIAVLLSLLNEKYWIKERTTAVLINVGGVDHLDFADNLCNCETIDLTSKYYQAEFGGPTLHFDGITVRAVIDGLKPNEVPAKIFLSDNAFVINGDISIISNPDIEFAKNRFIIHYKSDKKKDYTGSKDNIQLYDYDLIYIKYQNKTIASFVFMLVDKIDAEKIYNTKIVVENQQLKTREADQNAE